MAAAESGRAVATRNLLALGATPPEMQSPQEGEHAIPGLEAPKEVEATKAAPPIEIESGAIPEVLARLYGEGAVRCLPPLLRSPFHF